MQAYKVSITVDHDTGQALIASWTVCEPDTFDREYVTVLDRATTMFTPVGPLFDLCRLEARKWIRNRGVQLALALDDAAADAAVVSDRPEIADEGF